MNGRPMAFQRCLVLRHAIPLVLGKPVVRKTGVEVNHHPVPCHLRNDRGSRNAQAAAIALDQCLSGLFQPMRHISAVDKNVVGNKWQVIDGPHHGRKGCGANIDSIDRCR